MQGKEGESEIQLNRDTDLSQGGLVASDDGAPNASTSALSELSELPELSGLSRREMLKITAGAVIAAPLVGAAHSVNASTRMAEAAAKAPLFFTPEEFTLVDELTELIIPTDEHSPGARAAQAAAFIDSQLAEAWDPATRDRWREGLSLVNQLSQEINGKPFMEAASEQRIAVLTRMARSESPEKPEQQFFREVKSRTAHAYYTSKIGIHQELEYKGNTYQKEFSGFDAT